MIEAQLNYLDMAVVTIMLLSCVFAFFRGFVREILSLGAWVGAGIVTVYGFSSVAELLEPHFKKPMVAAAFGTLGLYIGSLLVFSMINSTIRKFIKSGSDVGILDNVLGLVFGAARGALIIALGFLLITLAIPENKKEPVWLEKALTRPYAARGALFLARIAPSYLQDIADFQKKAIDDAHGDKDENKAKNAEPPKEEEPYAKDKASQKLDQLLKNLRKEP